MPIDYKIDTRTAIEILALGNILIAYLFVLYRAQRDFPMLQIAARVIQSAGWIVFFHREVLPYGFWYIVGNSLLEVGFAAEVLAILSIRRQVRTWKIVYAVLIGLSLIDLVAHVAMNASINTKNFSASIVHFLIFVIPAYVLLTDRAASRFAHGVGWFYLLYCATSVARAVFVLNSDNVSILTNNWLHSVIFLGLIAILVFGSVGYMLLVKEESDNELLQAASTDALTGALNRRAFLSHAELARTFGVRGELPMTFLMIDIDNFKRINDRFGHGVGDQVLKAFTATVRRVVRPNDVFCRLGGEEFGLLLVCPKEQSAEAAERIRHEVENQTFAQVPALRYTVSMGGVSFNPAQVQSIESVFAEADRNLYQAKNEGRNRIVL
jgi:diguanylate cyclase (GGDEF)-like protein